MTDSNSTSLLPKLPTKGNLIVVAVKNYNPTKDDIIGLEGVECTEPQLSEQLIVKKGERYSVKGSVDWWLYVEHNGEFGYIPSTYVVPLKLDLDPKDESQLKHGAALSPSMIEKNVDLKYFPSASLGQSVRQPCPEDSANILSRLTFWWMNGMIYTGFKRPLVDSDLWALRSENRCSQVAPLIATKWQYALEACQKKHPTDNGTVVNGHASKPENEADEVIDASHPSELDQQKVEFVPKKKEAKKKCKKPSLAKILILQFWKKFVFVAFLKLVHDIALFVQPQMLDLIITFTSQKDEPSTRWKGYMYCLAIFGSAIIQSFCLHQYFHVITTIGMNLRTAIIGMVYPKALRLNSASRNKSTAGEMVNLMTTDAQRIMDLMTYLNTIWSGPFQIIVALYFLYHTMGWSILAGVGVMLLLIPINMFFSKHLKRLQVKVMAKTDGRLKLINEMLNGIKVLKLYAWEKSIHDKIMEWRNAELKNHRSSMYLNSVMTFTFTCAPFFVSLATFSIYVLTGNVLTANKAFVAIALFQILRFPLVIVPLIITSVIQARVSINRLEDFLSLDEIDEDNVIRTMPEQFSSQAIHAENCTISWDTQGSPILKDINLNIPSGSLVAVVGQVGCGKSTLLSALLGETEKLTGNVYVKGSVAYVPQQAWIQNATLRDNILFSRSYDRKRLKRIIKDCALQTDIDLLPAGEMTEIGEKGINLSGGQKQRVNLARAVYFNADVYLLDDPLSAVDSHVGKHIFDKVIGPRGVLQGKTRVLVTHAVHLLPQVDQIVVLQGGRISEIGTYDELQANQGAFAEFLKTYANEKQDEEEEGHHHEKSASMEHLDVSHHSGSKSDICSMAPSEDVQIQKVIEEETSQVGSVKLAVYMKYAKAVGVIITVLVILFTVISEACLVGSKIWLAHWSSINVTTDEERDYYLGMYSGFGLYQAVTAFIGSLILCFGAIKASRTLHDHLLHNLLRYPMSFFESTPQGRIVNRFSKDTFVIDDTIPRSFGTFFRCLFEVLSSIFVISYATPLFLVVVVPLAVFYFFVQRMYVASSRQLRRIESVSRSPIYNNFLETINGASTIRAYLQQQHFVTGNQLRVDENQVAYYPYIASNRWLAVRLEFVGNLVTVFAAIFAVAKRGSIESGLVGLAISQAFKITQTLNWVVRVSSELEANIVAVERVKEYSELPTEADWIIDDHRPPDDWPGSGNITIDSLDLRYRENLPLVLKNINCNITAGEKIGLVGRTGAGKSSLSLALFRVLESCGGKVIIDGVDLSTIGLHDLRSRLTIIPQDPVLFSGTLRFNLDPFDKHNDEELWNVLEVSHLKQFVAGLTEGLQHIVTEGGDNLSVGQRQLVCLARALLRKSKVLVLDEATAAVDLETDELIQNTIRTEFADRTVVTIAHRLNTIMDYSRIMVLDKGFVMELDTPSNLLEKRGIFYSMAKQANLV